MVQAYRSCLATALAIGLAPPALAQAPAASPPPAAGGTGNPSDPNELICERQEVLGSRLAKRKVCLTRAQWAERRLQDRQEIERVQVQRGVKGE